MEFQKNHLVFNTQNGEKMVNFWKKKYIGGHLQAKTFTIISPSYDDRGEYSCKVSNAVGPITKYVNFGMFSFIAF